jgi:hypothetical protein
MALNKYSYKSDVAANLYRAAFYLAKGSTSVAKDFLEKSGENFSNLKINSKKNRLYWAEKILDQYKKLRYS